MPRKAVSGPVSAVPVRRTRVAHRPTKSVPVVEPAPSVDSEDIARLAYSLWEERGCPADSPEEDWYQAEKILRASA